MNPLSEGKGVFANPKADSVFKNMFGTKKNEELTISLINSIIPNLNVVSVEFPNTELISGIADDRSARLDIFCTLASGERVIIEMQNARQIHFTHRMVFYASKVISTLDARRDGRWDYFFRDTYIIAFMSFNLDEEVAGSSADDPICCFRTVGRGSDVKLPGSTEYYFVQLPKFTKNESELCSITDFWLYSLVNAQEHEAMPENMSSNETFDRFYDGLLRAGFTKQQELDYLDDMTTQRDIYNQIQYGIQEGIAKGLSEGRAEGRAEGRVEGILAVARNMKKIGRPLEEIAQCTGLSMEEIGTLSTDK